MNDERFSRLEDKLDIVIEKIGSVDKTLAAQHVSLVEHIRRTELLEQAVIPIQTHVVQVQGVAKFFGALAVLAGILEGFTALLAFLRHK